VREIVGKVWIWVLVGIGIGAAIHGYVPEEMMLRIMGGEAWWSVPAAVVVGVPMYTNAAGVIPIVEALLGKGAALGTTLAFMMSVIALSLPEMIILKQVLTYRLIAIFIAVVAAGILATGFLFNAYLARDEDALTWFQDVPEVSLRLVRRHLPRGGAMIDVGGGASRLVDHVLDEGPGAMTVLDLSAEALAITRARLGSRAAGVSLVVADVRAWTPDRAYDLWHDRAVFHFLTDPVDQRRYLETLGASLRPGGVAIIATFDLTGPERCSNLAVQRYSPETLTGQIDSLIPDLLIPVHAERHGHRTPKGDVQDFQVSIYRKKEAPT
jgi:SAM-dependent methyltransferase